MHIGLRTIRKEKEDERYQKMRENWGASWRIQSYLKVFILQGILMFLISTPILSLIANSSTSFHPFILMVGFAVWLVGFAMESLSDSQLKNFKADPANKGRIMDQGLWSWSRHPNYFGEVLQWWGIFLMCWSGMASLWTVFAPLLIHFLILKVSGVDLLEKLMEGRPGYAEYKARTSRFIPWPPKS